MSKIKEKAVAWYRFMGLQGLSVFDTLWWFTLFSFILGVVAASLDDFALRFNLFDFQVSLSVGFFVAVFWFFFFRWLIRNLTWDEGAESEETYS